MQITMSDIVALKELYPSLKKSKTPVKLGYKLVRIFEEIDKQADTYAKMLSEIIDDCAKKDESGRPVLSEDGTQVVLLEEKIQECNSRLNELNSLKVDVDMKYNLTLEELDSFEDLTLEQIKLLTPFID